jgi:hypothetical protein
MGAASEFGKFPPWPPSSPPHERRDGKHGRDTGSVNQRGVDELIPTDPPPIHKPNRKNLKKQQHPRRPQ